MILLDVNTYLINMDVLVAEHVVKNIDDSYSIFINAKLSHDRQLEAYRHAMYHIKNGDFDKYNVDKIEIDAHNLEIALEFCG